MSDAGGGHSITNVNLTFDDSAASGLPDTAQIVSGAYKPTDFEPGDNFPPPAPVGAVSTFLTAFNGSNPNGNWSLYVVDDATGDSGLISNWSLSITTINPVSPAVNLVVTVTDAPDPVFVGSGLTYTLTLTNRGPSTATGVYLTDILAPGVTLGSSNTTFGTFSLAPTTVTINVGTVAAGSGLARRVWNAVSDGSSWIVRGGGSRDHLERRCFSGGIPACAVRRAKGGCARPAVCSEGEAGGRGGRR